MSTMLQRRTFMLAGTAMPMACLDSRAWAGSSPIEGQGFVELAAPQPAASADKVSVLAFFSYACPHCRAFEPALEAWSLAAAARVKFQRVPVPFLPFAAILQRTHYAGEAMRFGAAHRRRVFEAVQVERIRMDSVDRMAAVLARSGVDAFAFRAACDSFAVGAAVRRATQWTQTFGIDRGPGVPEIVVGGRFVTSPGRAGGSDRALEAVDRLVERWQPS